MNSIEILLKKNLTKNHLEIKNQKKIGALKKPVNLRTKLQKKIPDHKSQKKK